MTTIDDYATKYVNAKIERDGGILQVALHDGENGPLKWCDSAHTELSLLFRDIAGDPYNKVMLLTGTAGHFIDDTAAGAFSYINEAVPSPGVDRIYREGNDLLSALIDINVPVIAAIAGNAYPHAEIALLSDSVIASEDAVIKDVHLGMGLVPSDGVHIVWPMLLGMNRGRHYLLTGKEITAREALDWGLVSEVVPAGTELTRAREIAMVIAAQTAPVLRYTRQVMTLEIKRRLREDLAYGLSLEMLASSYGFWR